jgi:hypothetical protein
MSACNLDQAALYHLAMAHLSFFVFLLLQASVFGIGLLAVALTCAVLLLPERRSLARLLVLPALWVLPLVLAGVFYEADMKSAGWVGYLFVPVLVAYFGFSIWAVSTLPKQRLIAGACAAINTPFVFLSALVVAIAAGGTWP